MNIALDILLWMVIAFAILIASVIWAAIVIASVMTMSRFIKEYKKASAELEAEEKGEDTGPTHYF